MPKQKPVGRQANGPTLGDEADLRKTTGAVHGGVDAERNAV